MKQKYETTLLVFTYCISAPLLFYHIAILKPPSFFSVNICCQYPVHPLSGSDTNETHLETGIAKIKCTFFVFFPHDGSFRCQWHNNSLCVAFFHVDCCLNHTCISTVIYFLLFPFDGEKIFLCTMCELRYQISTVQ